MRIQKILTTIVLGISLSLLFLAYGEVKADDYLVKDGKAMAEIVISENPKRTVKFAAKELQAYIKKISGATLPIIPHFSIDKGKPENLIAQYPPEEKRLPIKIYIGESFHVEKLGVNDKDLDWGAYRMESGDGWLALLGKDTDFTPVGIWARSDSDWLSRGDKEWNEAIGDAGWKNEIGSRLYKSYSPELDLWKYDQKGTINAVYGFLRSLGVNWYMPGELGEIVPQMKDIKIPDVDKTVKPYFKLRKVSFMRYGNGEKQLPDNLWTLRQGMNCPYGYDDYHGLKAITRSEELRKNHPEYYALYNGKRDIDARTANPCLSSEGLFKENVKYLRMMFDMYDIPFLSVWPDDGFTSICQCEKCKGKDTPDRGSQGILSNYVWDYVNKVGKEIAKTHPDKMIIGGAYSTYLLPPTNIKKLNSNIMVHIVNARRRTKLTEAEAKNRRKVVKEWARLTDNKVISFNNIGGANTPNIFIEDIKAIKDDIIGEDMWINSGNLPLPGFYHLNYYVCARMWWNPDLDANKFLDDYYKTFYGPAAKEMKDFIEYYEIEQGKMKNINSAPVIKKALDLFAIAESKVNPNTVYGKRIAMFGEGLEGNRKFYEKIKDGRDNPPIFEISELNTNINLDGKLDESFWSELTGELKGLAKGDDIKYPAKFKIGLKDNNLYFGIKCYDEKGDPVNISKSKPLDDSGIWHGDVVEILLETPMNSYYQITVNPAGSICDLDRSTKKTNWFNWSSEADVKTYINEEKGYWTVEARIPFTPSTQDPLHEIIGSAPSREKPWFFNVCRQRIREESTELSAFSPTGAGFHKFLKFGKLTR